MFALLAGLFSGPATVVTTWFASLIGKIIGVLAILAVAASALASIYFSWETGIKDREDLKIQVQNQARIIQDKQAQIKQMQDMADIQARVQADQVKDNKAIDLQSDSVKEFLSHQTGKPASKLLKDTVTKLGGKHHRAKRRLLPLPTRITP